MSAEFATTVGGVRLPFPAMNASGARSSSAGELRDLARSATGAIVLKTATVHPFLHPQYRSLHNPGFDKMVPLVRELVAQARCPVIASVAGTAPDEYATLARAFAEAGASLVEANLADPWVAATLAPFDDRDALRAVLRMLVAASAVPVSVKLPERPALGWRALSGELLEAGIRVAVAKNDFAGFEKLLLESGRELEVIAVGGVESGYDVSRALAKGAKAVQVGSALVREGPALFARLEREMSSARARSAGGGRT
jgi:dihydroorotate dehydrogenase (fumarate)